MSESQRPLVTDSSPERLHVTRVSRLSFEVPHGNLKEALLGMYGNRARNEMGQRALFLYSEEQIHRYIPGTKQDAISTLLNSNLERRISTHKPKQHKPTRWVEAARPSGSNITYVRLGIMLAPETREQLLASVPDGLDKAKFGRKVIAVALEIPDSKIAETREARQAASRALRNVLWANDAPHIQASFETVASGQREYVKGIDWSSWTIKPELKQ